VRCGHLQSPEDKTLFFHRDRDYGREREGNRGETYAVQSSSFLKDGFKRLEKEGRGEGGKKGAMNALSAPLFEKSHQPAHTPWGEAIKSRTEGKRKGEEGEKGRERGEGRRWTRCRLSIPILHLKKRSQNMLRHAAEGGEGGEGGGKKKKKKKEGLACTQSVISYFKSHPLLCLPGDEKKGEREKKEGGGLSRRALSFSEGRPRVSSSGRKKECKE